MTKSKLGIALAFGTLASIVCADAATASEFDLVYTFSDPSGPYSPWGQFIFNGGSLYGTTLHGGGTSCAEGEGCGTVYKLTPSGTATVLYAFQGGSDGDLPLGHMYRDSSGNFYGAAGGGNSGCLGGCGILFKLAPNGTKTTLYTFAGGTDGYYPSGDLVADGAGNFYSVTSAGGDNDQGTIFKLDSSGTKTTLYSFCAKHNCKDGADPDAGLIADGSGNLYGVTYSGGDNQYYGTVFKLAPDGTYTVLHSFGSGDGEFPNSKLVSDGAGNLYGTSGGPGGYGQIFKLAADGSLSILHTFSSTDGKGPRALIRSAAGDFYGSAPYGGENLPACGNGPGCGTVFKLSSAGVFSVLYRFVGGSDGFSPNEVTLGTGPSSGSLALYGTTLDGNTAFKIIP
jgi:uncharacterized repeat protein (TIGR03803 family)